MGTKSTPNAPVSDIIFAFGAAMRAREDLETSGASNAIVRGSLKRCRLMVTKELGRLQACGFADEVMPRPYVQVLDTTVIMLRYVHQKAATLSTGCLTPLDIELQKLDDVVDRLDNFTENQCIAQSAPRLYDEVAALLEAKA